MELQLLILVSEAALQSITSRGPIPGDSDGNHYASASQQHMVQFRNGVPVIHPHTEPSAGLRRRRVIGLRGTEWRSGSAGEAESSSVTMDGTQSPSSW